MVFQDVSIDPANRGHRPSFTSSTARGLNIAPLNDRMMAFFFDFLIFSPLISLWVSGIHRQIHLSTLLEADDAILGGFWILYILGMLAVVVAVMSTFLYFWRATPGQKFMQLRVVSYPSVNFERQLTIDRCILRSVLWCASWSVLGLPFLEIISHPLRRAFHERASDTLVVSLKRVRDQGPALHEAHFIRNFLRLAFLGLAVLIGFFGFHTYGELSEEIDVVQTPKSKNNPECLVAMNESEELVDPMDLLMTLTYTHQVESECLNEQLDDYFLKLSPKNLAMAYLGKAITIDDSSEKRKYLDRACAESNSFVLSSIQQEDSNEICQIAHFLSDSSKDRKLQFFNVENKLLLFSRVLLLENYLENKDYIPAIAAVKSLQSYENLKSFLDNKYVAAIWNLKKISETSDHRKPASMENPSEEIFRDFEERFLKQ